MSVGHIGYWAAVTLGIACLLVIVLLVLVRLFADRAERRREALRTPLWRVVLTLSAGEPDEADAAYATLAGLPAEDRRAVEEDLLALVPKLRGESRQRVRDLLRAWGGTERGRHSTSSVSAVRRARGYHRLGVLALDDRRDEVLAGLADRDFTARRTAMLALASFPEPEVIERMLATAATDVRLRHDFLAAVDQIGSVAAPVMVAHLERPLTDHESQERHLAAEALGLLGAIEAVPALERCLDEPDEELRIAALRALGSLGAPSSVGIVGDQLGDGSRAVRRATAVAAGMIGSGPALGVLERALEDPDVEVARAAATALRRMGDPGLGVLDASEAPVAREALALAALRSVP